MKVNEDTLHTEEIKLHNIEFYTDVEDSYCPPIASKRIAPKIKYQVTMDNGKELEIDRKLSLHSNSKDIDFIKALQDVVYDDLGKKDDAKCGK